MFLSVTHVQYASMYYIVGLGNPGKEYEHTRHNVGFLALDFIVDSLQLPLPTKASHLEGRYAVGKIADTDVALLYPDTFMNHSGNAVKKLVSRDEIQSLIVLYDDVALPFGTIKVAFDRGDGGHNGLKSIIDVLGSKEFIRVRIGVGPTSFWTGALKQLGGEALPRFVLGKFSSKERTKLSEEILVQVQKAVCEIVRDGYQKAMNTYN